MNKPNMICGADGFECSTTQEMQNHMGIEHETLSDRINTLLWELQLFTELHTPGMLILLDKERAKYVEKIERLLTGVTHE